MVGIGAKIFNRTDDLDVARKLVNGCIWAYDSMPTGIMPETFTAVSCNGVEDCTWRVEKWNEAVKNAGFGEYARQLDAADIIKEEGLAPGFARITDRRFLLRYVPGPCPPTRSLANNPLAPRPLNPYSSCTASPATRRYKMPHGASSAPSTTRRAQSTRTRPLPT
jgi:hypothetical protein